MPATVLSVIRCRYEAGVGHSTWRSSSSPIRRTIRSSTR